MSNKKSSLTKREAIRARRASQQRQKRMTTFLAIGAVAIVLAAIIIVPSVLRANAPVGEFTTITPRDLPQPNDTALGDPNAPVTIEVYEDFQCPACKSYSEGVEHQIIENEVATGRVYYVFRQWAFLDTLDASSLTNESQQAASASLCAADQGRFWDYHDILFANWNGENQGAFSDQRLVAFAESLGLDMDEFNACFKENRHADRIAQELEMGRSLGVTGTPTVLVNGKIVKPGFVPSYEDVKAAVDQALAASSN